MLQASSPCLTATLVAGNPRQMVETARRSRRLTPIYEYVTRLPASGQRSVSRTMDVPDRAGWTVALASVSVPALTFVPVYASGRLPSAEHAPHATIARSSVLALAPAPARPCARSRLPARLPVCPSPLAPSLARLAGRAGTPTRAPPTPPGALCETGAGVRAKVATPFEEMSLFIR